MDAATRSTLRSLTVPVNSAAHWQHLYVEDDLELVGDGDEVIDLTSTSRPLDLRPTVATTA
ncbi:MAG TPA: hypothetical protein VD926_10110 [Acidimicrobiales bacterium]|nr:hypothetical protein [Acidimicrobiales bacterium]